MRVYVIDDDSSVCNSLRFLLSTLKMECRTFASGTAFLDELERLEPGCILLDIDLGSVSGLEVQAELRRRKIDWPVIILTGQCSLQLASKAYQAGAVDYVVKPSTEKDLLSALTRSAERLLAA